MKLGLSRLISFIFLFFYCANVLAEDVYIHHQNYGNTHSKWKNRLEEAGHTVTSSTNSITDFSSYEQYYDLRYSGSSLPTDGLKTILSNGGTVFLNGENTNFTSRNNLIQSFIRDVTSDNSITYSTSLNIDYSGPNEQLSTTSILSTLPSDWAYLNFAFGGVISNLGTNGKCLAANGQGRCGVALFDGDALSSSYSNGKVIIITDINYASHSQYYTADNKEFLTSLISDVITSTVNTTSAVTVTITSSQTTSVNTAKGTSSNGVNMNVNGDNNTVNIQQSGQDNFITGSNWSGDATITGDNNNLSVDQGNITTSGSSGRNGIGLDINGSTNTVNVSQGDYSVDVGDHRIMLDIDGSTNTTNLTQRNDGDANSEHYMSVDIDASQNVISLQQLNDGDKVLFLDIDNANNTVDVTQSGSGQHYLDLKLGTGSYAHDVDISQTGSGDHAGRIDLDGYSTDFDLIQQGSTDQNYNIDMTCGTQSGCSVSTTQGN